MRTILFVFCVLFAGPAFGQTEEEREADMFGSSESTVEEVEAVPSSEDADTRVEDVFGTRTSTTDAMLRLVEEDDKLAIGGLFFVRANYSILDEGELEDFALSNPTLVDLYLDARLSSNIRFYTRGRLNFDPTVVESTQSGFAQSREKLTTQLDQLWLKFDLENSVYFTVGKQRVKWGTGRFWNPTDFLNNETLDPLSVTTFDERLGVSLLRVHLPIESWGANFYAIATLDDASRPADVGGALRAEVLLGTSEWSASFAARRNNPLRFGSDMSAGVGPIDIRVEAAVQHKVRTPFYRGEYNTSPLSIAEFDLGGVAPEDLPDALQAQLPGVLAARLPESYSREDDWIPQVTVGAEYGFNYTEDDAIYLGAEYFFNDAGYSDATLYPVLFQSGQFRPFYTGRHYAGLYVALPQPGSWNDTTFTTSALGNLSDRSFITRLDYSLRLLTFLTFNAFVQGHLGDKGEFNYSYSQAALLDPALVAQIPAEFRDQIPGELTEPVYVVGPAMSLGLGLRASF